MSRFSIATQVARNPAALVSPCNTCEVRDFAACAPLNPEEQKRLVSIMTTVAVDPHQSIFDAADAADHVFNVTSGAV